MIINIRGTSGSGKTHTVRSFMEAYGPSLEIFGEDKNKPIAHLVHYDMVPVYFIGSYRNVCGGCDSISTQDMACSLVRHFSNFGHVVFEGLLMSHLFARYQALYEELSGYEIPFVFAYMDTPLKLCLERVQQRRTDKGNDKELDPKNTISHYDATLKTMEKFKEVNAPVDWIDHTKDPIEEMKRFLDEDSNYLFKWSYREESFK